MSELSGERGVGREPAASTEVVVIGAFYPDAVDTATGLR
jgi:hypothetical protein